MSRVEHIEIAGKKLPVRVDESSRDNLMEAVRLINEKMAEFEKSYAIKDKSELLAMVTLYLVSIMAKKESELREELKVFQKMFEEIKGMLQWHKEEVLKIQSTPDPDNSNP
ncbi:MAG: cell division protein ZapA [Bacteroidia bacterium]|nr:cell division protein ZapA [Bacteroidia bacterium]